MPVRAERFVELLCDFSIEGFVAPIVVNLLLILACAVYAFKTRRLPDNFNESRYIFLCVCTTIFIWVAFLPTYFAAYRSYHKIIVLSSALILNNTVMLLCLFVPKVYAIYYVNESEIKWGTANTAQVAPSAHASGSVQKDSLAPPTVSSHTV